MFDELDAFVFILLPELQMTINTCGNYEVRAESIYRLKIIMISNKF